MSAKLRRQSGISIVELITALGIIALISAVMIPQYNKFTSRSRMAEAKRTLKAIHSLQLTFYDDYSRFGLVPPTGKLADGSVACDSNEIGFALSGCTAPSSRIRYRYEVTTPGGPENFTATASGIIVEGCTTEDVWVIRKDGILRHTVDASLLCR